MHLVLSYSILFFITDYGAKTTGLIFPSRPVLDWGQTFHTAYFFLKMYYSKLMQYIEFYV